MKMKEKIMLEILVASLFLLITCFIYKIFILETENETFGDIENYIRSIARGEQQEEFKLTGADLQHGSSENQFEGEAGLF